MPRTLTFTNGADTFTQGGSAQNIGITLRMLGGNDRVELTRNDDFGGGTVVRRVGVQANPAIGAGVVAGHRVPQWRHLPAHRAK